LNKPEDVKWLKSYNKLGYNQLLGLIVLKKKYTLDYVEHFGYMFFFYDEFN